ncbi:MAG: DUF5674 family protein [Deltaproteobacteria bacterium]|jgi:hypothetical protein|nr:DUF5674 family protein [Deltaproteobacteria bacterium]
MKQVGKISLAELRQMAERMFGSLVKADVDIVRKIMVIDADLHADIEALMLENGSQQADLWGINLHPDKFGTDDFIEFDSMINIRPRQKNMSRYVEDEIIRQQIIKIVNEIVYE